MLKNGFCSGIALLALLSASVSASAQETVRLTIATGHPEVFLWVKHLKETFIPVLDEELAKTNEIKIEWTEGYGGTIVRLGSEVEAFQQGIIDVSWMSGIFNPAQLGLLNLSLAMPFGPADPRVVTEAAEAALQETEGALESLEVAGVVYIGGGIAIDDYNIWATKPLRTRADLSGVKLGGSGPNLSWLQGTGAVGVQAAIVAAYNDINSGVYDGYIGWMTGGIPARLYEVAPFWNEVNLGAPYSGGLGVSKQQWDTFSEDTKAAFRTAAAAYSAAYFDEQDARYETSKNTLIENGGEIVEFDAAERAAWIEQLPNPATAWLAATEARGEPGRELLEAYVRNLEAAGFVFARDYLAE